MSEAKPERCVCCTACRRVHSGECCSCRKPLNRKPAPAPEPKQGSEVPGDEPVTELEAEKSTSKILRVQLAKAIAERDEARATKDLHKERQEEAWAEVDALRAQLAAAREEIAAWTKDSNDAREAFATEKARADRAEVAVEEVKYRFEQALNNGFEEWIIDRWNVILARARKEGGGR